jgi:hypothetical protein
MIHLNVVLYIKRRETFSYNKIDIIIIKIDIIIISAIGI